MFLLPQEYWEIRNTKKKGRGVFAKKDIDAGTIIGDYIGTFIHSEDEEKYDKKHGFYTMYYHERASIFPDVKKPGIHIINHSCTPNAYMYSYQGHTLYFALRRIFAGEEITVSYLVNPLDDADCEPCTHMCNCGADICTNTFHTTKKEHERWSEFDNKMTEDVQLPRVTYGKELALLDSYPKRISDHSVYPLFGSALKPPVKLSDTKIPSKRAIREKIRNTGKHLYFQKLGITVKGISDNHLICTQN